MKNDLNTSKSIETPFLRVRGNCLEIQNTVIQLSNISLLSTTDVTPEKFPIYSIIIILAGIASLAILKIVSVILIAIGGLWIYYWYSSAQKAQEMKRLTIITNSGNAFPIVFDNRQFMEKVVKIMTEIIRDPKHTQNFTINIKECSFSDDSSVIHTFHEN